MKQLHKSLTICYHDYVIDKCLCVHHDLWFEGQIQSLTFCIYEDIDQQINEYLKNNVSKWESGELRLLSSDDKMNVFGTLEHSKDTQSIISGGFRVSNHYSIQFSTRGRLYTNPQFIIEWCTKLKYSETISFEKNNFEQIQMG